MLRRRLAADADRSLAAELVGAAATSLPRRASRHAAAGGKTGNGLGFYVSDHNPKTFVDFGAFISALLYFIIFIAVVYFVIVVPYKHVQVRRGQTVFGDPTPVKTCPACLSTDLPLAASKYRYCGTDQPPAAA